MKTTPNLNESTTNTLEIKETKPESYSSISRRRFPGNVGKTTAADLAAGVVGVQPLLASEGTVAKANKVGPKKLQSLQNIICILSHIIVWSRRQAGLLRPINPKSLCQQRESIKLFRKKKKQVIMHRHSANIINLAWLFFVC